MVTPEQQKEFEELARPLIRFLNDNFGPHTEIAIDTTGAHMVIGEMGFYTEDYLKD